MPTETEMRALYAIVRARWAADGDPLFDDLPAPQAMAWNADYEHLRCDERPVAFTRLEGGGGPVETDDPDVVGSAYTVTLTRYRDGQPHPARRVFHVTGAEAAQVWAAH